jgi:hypothetical protein
MGPREGYLGRILIEVWQPSASTGDGILIATESEIDPSGSPGDEKFLRETIARLAARLGVTPHL